MPEDKKHEKERIEKELLASDNEAAQANTDIQDQFYSDEEADGPSSSPVPLVANNTAPLSPATDEKKKK